MSQAGKESGIGKRERPKDMEKMGAVYIGWVDGFGGGFLADTFGHPRVGQTRCLR